MHEVIHINTLLSLFSIFILCFLHCLLRSRLLCYRRSPSTSVCVCVCVCVCVLCYPATFISAARPLASPHPLLNPQEYMRVPLLHPVTGNHHTLKIALELFSQEGRTTTTASDPRKERKHIKRNEDKPK